MKHKCLWLCLSETVRLTIKLLLVQKSGKWYRVRCLKRICKTIWPDCSSYYLNVSQKAKAKNELLIAIIWIARCGSTCLLEGFVHSFTLPWTAALNDASLFFFYFYPLAVNNNWLYAGCRVSSKQWKQSNVVGIICMLCGALHCL